MNRRAVFWTITGLCGVFVLSVAGIILYSFFNEDLVTTSEGSVAYLVVFALVFCDALVPIFPGRRRSTPRRWSHRRVGSISGP